MSTELVDGFVSRNGDGTVTLEITVSEGYFELIKETKKKILEEQEIDLNYSEYIEQVIHDYAYISVALKKMGITESMLGIEQDNHMYG